MCSANLGPEFAFREGRMSMVVVLATEGAPLAEAVRRRAAVRPDFDIEVACYELDPAIDLWIGQRSAECLSESGDGDEVAMLSHRSVHLIVGLHQVMTTCS